MIAADIIAKRAPTRTAAQAMAACRLGYEERNAFWPKKSRHDATSGHAVSASDEDTKNQSHELLSRRWRPMVLQSRK